MHREDNSKFLLYIEPDATEKSESPIEDDLTKLVDFAMSRAKVGVSNYSSKNEPESFREGSGFKGKHSTACGKMSDNHDYLLENGMITNSLAPYYVRWYRDSLPDSEVKKLEKLTEFYDGQDLTIKEKEKPKTHIPSFSRFSDNRRRKK